MSESKKIGIFVVFVVLASFAGMVIFSRIVPQYVPQWFGLWGVQLGKKNLDFNVAHVRGKEHVVPFLVLGSGPAALSAALYGARARIKTVVLRGNKPGGQLTGTSFIENWPGIFKIRGSEVVHDLQAQAEHFGAQIVDDAVARIDIAQWPYRVETEEGRVLYALSIMIGTGATPRKLQVPGEQEYFGKGVTTCAICDAPYHKDNDVVVVGGGDSAMEEALELSAYANTVKILVRGDKLKASHSMVERIQAMSNIVLCFNKEIAEIRGANEHVSSIVVRDTRTGEIAEWKIEGVFLGIGLDPNTSFLKNVVDLDEAGNIKLAGRHQITSVPGIVAAGDVSDKYYRQAGVAAGDGIKAGLDVVWWLSSVGYNHEVQNSLEPYFFDVSLLQKVSLEQLASLGEYEELLRESNKRLIVLDFYTPYCPSCMHMMPIMEWIATKLHDTVALYKIDASLAFDLVRYFKVSDVPTVLVIKDGQEMKRYKEITKRAEFYVDLKELLAS